MPIGETTGAALRLLGTRLSHRLSATPNASISPLADLEKHPWNAAGINVVVRNGILELSGVIFDERQRQALKVAAENVPGVKTVHDHLAWVEPISGTVIDSLEDIAARKAIE